MRASHYRILVTLILVVGVHQCACCQEVAESVAMEMAMDPASSTSDMRHQIKWLREYNSARLKGIEKSRLVLLFITTEHCIYCEKMHDQAFSDHEVIREVQQSFVPAELKLDPTSELARQLQITIYPTTLIIDTDGTILDYARGFISKDDLRHRMSKASLSTNRLASAPAGEP
jgi:protein disulfide-isomerase